MVSYVYLNGVYHSVAILLVINVIRLKCHVRWLRLHFLRMIITGLGQYTLDKSSIDDGLASRGDYQ